MLEVTVCPQVVSDIIAREMMAIIKDSKFVDYDYDDLYNLVLQTLKENDLME